jgi:hypothetical protein
MAKELQRQQGTLWKYWREMHDPPACWQDVVVVAGETAFDNLGGYDFEGQLPSLTTLMERDEAACGNSPFLDPEAEVRALVIDIVERCLLIGYGLARTAPAMPEGMDGWVSQALETVGLDQVPPVVEKPKLAVVAGGEK